MSMLRTSVLKSSRATQLQTVVGGQTRRTYATERPPPPTRQPVVEVFSGPSRRRSSRPYATETTRADAQKSSTSEPVVELFSDSARPRPYYAKHPPFRDLPKTKVCLISLIVLLASLIWRYSLMVLSSLLQSLLVSPGGAPSTPTLPIRRSSPAESIAASFVLSRSTLSSGRCSVKLYDLNQSGT